MSKVMTRLFVAGCAAMIWASFAGAYVKCRPYTVERVCPTGPRSCHLHMVYAPGHNPAGVVPDGYWYSASPRKHLHSRHHRAKVAMKVHHHHHRATYNRAHVTHCGFTCWYLHPPEHRY